MKTRVLLHAEILLVLQYLPLSWNLTFWDLYKRNAAFVGLLLDILRENEV